MTLLEKAEKKPTKSTWIIAVIVATLCTIGLGIYYFYGSRELRGMDIAMLFIIIGFVAYGATQTIIRGVLTAIAIYLATATAGTFYRVLAPYARSFLAVVGRIGLSRPPAGDVDTSALGLSFAFAAVVLWVVLEVLFRAALPDTHLAFLGPADRVGGALVYLVVGILVAALAFSIVGYGVAGRAAHNQASLRPEFNRVIDLIYRTQSFWFAGRPPAIYVYD